MACTAFISDPRQPSQNQPPASEPNVTMKIPCSLQLVLLSALTTRAAPALHGNDHAGMVAKAQRAQPAAIGRDGVPTFAGYGVYGDYGDYKGLTPPTSTETAVLTATTTPNIHETFVTVTVNSTVTVTADTPAMPSISSTEEPAPTDSTIVIPIPGFTASPSTA